MATGTVVNLHIARCQGLDRRHAVELPAFSEYPSDRALGFRFLQAEPFYAGTKNQGSRCAGINNQAARPVVRINGQMIIVPDPNELGAAVTVRSEVIPERVQADRRPAEPFAPTKPAMRAYPKKKGIWFRR